MNQTILNAVRNMQTLTFWYHGESRTVDPHCYGRDGKGHDAIRAYQHGKGWRLFHVHELRSLSAGSQGFRPQNDYKRNDKAMDRIYAQV